MEILTHQQEDQLLELLAQRRACDADSGEASQYDRAIVAVIEEQLRDDLRRIMFHKFGQHLDTNRGSHRFSELLQSFFVNVLQRSPPGLAKVRTREELLLYVSVALSNMLRNHFRLDAGKREKGEPIAMLAALRQQEVQRDCPLELRDVLEQVAAWQEGANDLQRTWAIVLRFYYVIGMTFREIGEEMDVSKSTAERHHAAAIQELRRILRKEC